MTDTAPSDTRPWHLDIPSAAPGPFADGAGPDRGESRAPSPPANGPGSESAAQPPLPPLWKRIVSGQSFAWRIRRVRNKVRWARRRAARRGLRWLDLHPEVRDAARTGEYRRLAGLVPRRGARPAARSRAVVHSDVAFEVDDAERGAPSPLGSSIDLRLAVDTPDRPVHRVVDDGRWVTVTRGADAEATIAAPVDQQVWNPMRFQARPPGGRVTITGLPMGDDLRAARRRLQLAHRARSVSCATATPLTMPAEQLGRTVIELACSGAPLVGELAPEVAVHVDDDIAAAIAAHDPGDLEDPDDPGCLLDDRERALHCLHLRRLALARYAARDVWSAIGRALGVGVDATPGVSVLLPSNRPDDVVDAARQVASQRDVAVQLVVGLHGAHMPDDLEARLAEHAPADLVVRRLDDELNLGDVMNELTAAADGHLVSKWDDDDWYDPLHLSDLVRALEFSGAGMVGKAAEFIHLESLGVTIRRFATGAERPSTTIAGGTLLLERSVLADTGWASVPRQVDRRLIDALEARGLGIYRTHGFGYILRRRSAAMAQHTWQAGDSYFLGQATDQRPGLDFAFAGISGGDAPTPNAEVGS